MQTWNWHSMVGIVVAGSVLCCLCAVLLDLTLLLTSIDRLETLTADAAAATAQQAEHPSSTGFLDLTARQYLSLHGYQSAQVRVEQCVLEDAPPTMPAFCHVNHPDTAPIRLSVQVPAPLVFLRVWDDDLRLTIYATATAH